MNTTWIQEYCGGRGQMGKYNNSSFTTKNFLTEREKFIEKYSAKPICSDDKIIIPIMNYHERGGDEYDPFATHAVKYFQNSGVETYVSCQGHPFHNPYICFYIHSLIRLDIVGELIDYDYSHQINRPIIAYEGGFTPAAFIINFFDTLSLMYFNNLIGVSYSDQIEYAKKRIRQVTKGEREIEFIEPTIEEIELVMSSEVNWKR